MGRVSTHRREDYWSYSKIRGWAYPLSCQKCRKFAPSSALHHVEKNRVCCRCHRRSVRPCRLASKISTEEQTVDVEIRRKAWRNPDAPPAGVDVMGHAPPGIA